MPYRKTTCIKSHLATVNVCLLFNLPSGGASSQHRDHDHQDCDQSCCISACFVAFPGDSTVSLLSLLTGCLLPPRLPHGSQGLTGLCRGSARFPLCPSSAVMACLEAHPSGPALAAGALSGSSFRVGSGEGSLRSHPSSSYKPKQCRRL